MNVFPAISPGPTSGTARPEAEATGDDRDVLERNNHITLKPSPPCRWSTHYRNTLQYERCWPRTPTPDASPEPLDEASWKPWPNSWQEPSYQTRLLDNLATNDFSNIGAKDLPIAVPQIVKAAEAQGDELLEEAYGFAIMAPNTGMLEDFDQRPEIWNDETVKEELGQPQSGASRNYVSGRLQSMLYCAASHSVPGEFALEVSYIKSEQPRLYRLRQSSNRYPKGPYIYSPSSSRR